MNFRTNGFAPSVSTLALALGVSGCVTPSSLPGADQAFTVNFEARVGDKPAKCGETYQDVGASKARIMLQDFRVYVSEVRLLAADGHEVPLKLTPDSQWQNDQVALLDFENATGNCNGNAPTNMSLRGSAPAGDYRGVAFDISVPFGLNHKDPTLAAAPLNYSGLTWPWRIGYKFVTIDLETAGATPPAGHAGSQPGAAAGGMHAGMHAGSATGFSIHLGSTDCGAGSPTTAPTGPCDNSNRPGYRLENIDLAKQKIVLDLGALLARTDVTVNAPNSASGCMSFVNDDDCIAIMDRFGLSFRGKASSGQQFVRAS